MPSGYASVTTCFEAECDLSQCRLYVTPGNYSLARLVRVVKDQCLATSIKYIWDILWPIMGENEHETVQHSGPCIQAYSWNQHEW